MVVAAPRSAALLRTFSPGNTPVGSPAEWVLLAAARRETDDAQAPAAAKTTLTLDTYDDVVAASQKGVFLRGVVSDYFSPVPDSSWTVEHTSLLDGKDLGIFGDETTLTYTTPYADTFLKEHANALLYAPSDYTAWITAERVDNPGVIVGAEKLSLGYTLVAPAVAGAVQHDGTIEWSPVRDMRYVVVFVPSNVTPIFPGGDITPPTAAPTISSPAKASTSVTLSITGGVDDVAVTGYDVYRFQYPPGYDGTQSLLGIVALSKVNDQPVTVGATFTDTGLEPLTTYGYTARAVDSTGLESLDSEVISVQTPEPDTIPPTPPVITATKITKTTVTLLASGGTDDVGVVGYEIYRDDSTQSYLLLATVAVGETFVDSVSPDSGYIYFARAFDAAGNVSDTSERLLVETPITDPPDDPDYDDSPPTAPVLKPSNVTATTVALTPSGGEDNVGVVGYSIFQDGRLIAYGVAAGTTITVEDLAPDTSYTFTARAVDAMFNESEDSRAVLVETLSEGSTGTPRTPGMTEDFDHNLPDYVTRAIRTVVKNVPPNWQQGVADGLEQLYRVVSNIPLISNAFAVVQAFVHLGDLEIAIKLHDTGKLNDALYGFYWDVLSATPLVGNAVGIAEGLWGWTADLFNEEERAEKAQEAAEHKIVDAVFRATPGLNILHLMVEDVLIPSLREKYGWT
jgi:chitodextrinase